MIRFYPVWWLYLEFGTDFYWSVKVSLDPFSSTRRSVEMRFEHESNWFSRCTYMLVFWRWWCCVIPDNRARCDGLQLVIAVSLYIHGPSSWFGGLSFPSGSWAVLMVSPTVKTAALFPRLPVSPLGLGVTDEQTLWSLGTTLTSKKTRDAAAVEICGSSFFFFL